jgi:hypothetical protein
VDDEPACRARPIPSTIQATPPSNTASLEEAIFRPPSSAPFPDLPFSSSGPLLMFSQHGVMVPTDTARIQAKAPDLQEDSPFLSSLLDA